VVVVGATCKLNRQYILESDGAAYKSSERRNGHSQ
jgi:hypothetical protein